MQKNPTTLNGCYYESPIDLIPKYHHRSTTTLDLSDMFKTFRHSLYFATQGRETERNKPTNNVAQNILSIINHQRADDEPELLFSAIRTLA